MAVSIKYGRILPAVIVIVLILGCKLGGPDLETVTPRPSFAKIGWLIQNVHESFWAANGIDSDVSASYYFTIEILDPFAPEDIVLIQVTAPDSSHTWILKDSASGIDHSFPGSLFWGGWGYSNPSHPHTIPLGAYTVTAVDTAGNRIETSFTVTRPRGNTAGTFTFLYSESHTETAESGYPMLPRPASVFAVADGDNLEITFRARSPDVTNGYLWFFDNNGDYIGTSSYFRTMVNGGHGFRTQPGTNGLNRLVLTPSNLNIDPYSIADIDSYFVVFTDSDVHSASKWNHRSVSAHTIVGAPSDLFTITYDGNGNTGGFPPMDYELYEPGQTVTVEATPDYFQKSRFLFAGWSTDADSSEAMYTAGDTFLMGNEDVTLYAVWIPVFSVIYDLNSGTTGGHTPGIVLFPQWYEEGAEVTVFGKPESLVKAGYTFSGWNTEPDGNGATYQEGAVFTMGSSDVTLYALWTENPSYTVRYDGNGSTSGAPPAPDTLYRVGETVTVLGNDGDFSLSGYLFGGWNSQADGTGYTVLSGHTLVMESGDLTLYAVWIRVFAVSYDGNGHTGGSVPVDDKLYRTGWTATVYGNTGNAVKTGYYFTEWNTCPSGGGTAYAAGSLLQIQDFDVTLYAIWSIASSVVSAGYSHTMVVRSDGTLWAAGNNGSGQLGDGTTTNRTFPTNIMSDVQSVSAGIHHTMILKTDGTLWGCGKNTDGQLGDGTAIDRIAPVHVMDNVAAVFAGSHHTMILLTDGTLHATGRNSFGELGDGTTIQRNAPVQVMSDVSSVSANYHTMILRTDGTLYATGLNSLGQLGTGDNTNVSIPVQVMSGVTFVSAGYRHTMVVKNDGTLWATGDNSFYAFGDGTQISSDMPVQIMGDVKSVTASNEHTMIIRTWGTLLVAGLGDYGQMGTGKMSDLKTTPFVIMTGVEAVSTGYHHTMIRKTDGSLWATGRNTFGQLFDSTVNDRNTPALVM